MKRSKNKQKCSKNKWKTTKIIVTFAGCEWTLTWCECLRRSEWIWTPFWCCQHWRNWCIKFAVSLGFRLITYECDTCQPFGFRTFQAAVDKMYALEDNKCLRVFPWVLKLNACTIFIENISRWMFRSPGTMYNLDIKLYSIQLCELFLEEPLLLLVRLSVLFIIYLWLLKFVHFYDENNKRLILN